CHFFLLSPFPLFLIIKMFISFSKIIISGTNIFGHTNECKEVSYMLNDKQLTQCKKELLSRQNVIQQHLEEHFGLENAAIHESSSELSSYDNHPADNGSELFERQKDIALNEHEKKELTYIEIALSNIDNVSTGNI